MDTNTLFMIASREKYRFANQVGTPTITIEDLWDLPLTSARGPNLDDIARGLHRQLKESEDVISFVKPVVKKTAEVQAKFDIVKFVIETKVNENEAAKTAQEKKDRKQELLGLLKEKRLDELKGLSAADLEKKIAEL